MHQGLFGGDGSRQDPDGFWRFAEERAREARRARRAKVMMTVVGVVCALVAVYFLSDYWQRWYRYYQGFHIVVRIAILFWFGFGLYNLLLAFTPLVSKSPEEQFSMGLRQWGGAILVFIAAGMYTGWRDGPARNVRAWDPNAPLTHDGPIDSIGCSGTITHQQVSRDKMWFDTGCFVAPGRSIEFTVVQHNMHRRDIRSCGPEGCKPEDIPELAGDLLCRDFPFMALIGRVNGGTCFLIGRQQRIYSNLVGVGNLEVSWNNEVYKKVGGWDADHEWRLLDGQMRYKSKGE